MWLSDGGGGDRTHGSCTPLRISNSVALPLGHTSITHGTSYALQVGGSRQAAEIAWPEKREPFSKAVIRMATVLTMASSLKPHVGVGSRRSDLQPLVEFWVIDGRSILRINREQGFIILAKRMVGRGKSAD